MEYSIKLSGLKRSFDSIKAVDDISFSVKPGEMFGLVGPDGAGKTTTIRLLCGLIPANEGNIEVLDMNMAKSKKQIQNKIGYLSQKFSLYGDLTIDENIEFFADIHGVKAYQKRRDELLEFTRLTPFRKRLADNLSGGMKQKLALACSLIHKPEIIFLDEPTTGVDPVSRRDFWKILSDLLKEGITVFMTTPYLDEAERCNRVALMNNGKIISLNTPSEIKKSINKIVIELITSDIKKSFELLRDVLNKEVQIFGDRINIVVDDYEKEFSEISNLQSKNNIQILSHRTIAPSLENVFIHLVKEAN